MSTSHRHRMDTLAELKRGLSLDLTSRSSTASNSDLITPVPFPGMTTPEIYSILLSPIKSISSPIFLPNGDNDDSVNEVSPKFFPELSSPSKENCFSYPLQTHAINQNIAGDTFTVAANDHGLLPLTFSNTIPNANIIIDCNTQGLPGQGGFSSATNYLPPQEPHPQFQQIQDIQTTHSSTFYNNQNQQRPFQAIQYKETSLVTKNKIEDSCVQQQKADCPTVSLLEISEFSTNNFGGNGIKMINKTFNNSIEMDDPAAAPDSYEEYMEDDSQSNSRSSSSGSSQLSSSSNANSSEAEEKKIRRRERNKKAAAKCLNKKKERIVMLDCTVEHLKKEVTELTNVRDEWEEKIRRLKEQIMEHTFLGCNINLSK